MDFFQPLRPPNLSKHPERSIFYQVRMTREEYLTTRREAARLKIPHKELCRDMLEKMFSHWRAPTVMAPHVPGVGHTVQISITPEERAAITHNAKRLGLGVQEYVRSHMLPAINSIIENDET